MRRMNGWSRDGINMPKESVRPAGPTQWEALLREYNLQESEALCVLRGKGKKSAQLRQWIIKHRNAVYVPPNVLETLGIGTRWEELDTDFKIALR